MPEEHTPEGTGKRIGKEILSFVLYFVIVIAAMLLIIHYVGQRRSSVTCVLTSLMC